MDSFSPRPTLPLNWWSWESPNLFAFSITITLALGKSIPTSIIVVETKILNLLFKKSLSITFFSFSLYETEKRIWKNIYKLNDALFPYLGFHIAHYSKSVRDKCYTCVRLRDEVISFKGDQVDKTFKEDIPNVFRRNRTQFKKSQRHLAESVAYPSAREPSYVK